MTWERVAGVDIGGTFTDFILYDREEQSLTVHKVPSGRVAEETLGTGLVELCEQARIVREELHAILHGTTVATNAMLQYRGAKVGFLTTAGFRDILHIGRHQRPLHYSIMQDIPWQARPLVQRRLRKTVPERVEPPKGEVVVPLDEEAVRQVAAEFRDAGVQAVAVGFLCSYLNPGHEARAKEILLDELPGVLVTTSSELFPQFREFERFTSVAMNAFVAPLVARYLSQLEGALKTKGIKAPLYIMMSNGGTATVAAASGKPVTLLMSGPAAGILGGSWSGKQSGRDQVITFDMGGTSADIGIVTDQGIVEAPARDTWVAGYPLLVPMLDVHTVGAGGGSIAYVDSGGAFRVGPRSAGAEPGPACYGLGGEEPTITDAHVVLGRIDPDRFLGGEMPLDRERAQKVVGRLGEALGMGLEETAEGILTVANNNMADAIRSRTVERGRDPRQFALVAFGGAGPLHAVQLAEALDIAEVLIPPYPGITSALGLLTTDLRYDQMSTVFMLSSGVDFARVNHLLEEQRTELYSRLKEDGLEDERIGINHALDCRYVGQGYELRVRLPDKKLGTEALRTVVAEFHEIHEREYGHSFPGEEIEIVNLRTTAQGAIPTMSEFHGETGATMDAAKLGEGRGVFRVDGELKEYSVSHFDRWKLPVHRELEGAAIVFQRDTTILVPPNWVAERDEKSNLILTRAKDE